MTTTAKYRPLPSAEEIQRWLKYDPATGMLYRIARNYSNKWGKQTRVPCEPPISAGRVGKCGYLMIGLLGMSNISASRLIWRMQTGVDPGSRQIDHINGNKLDNRWVNLRLADRPQNMWNRTKHPQRKGLPPLSTRKGVHPVKDKRMKTARFRARIAVRGKTINLGSFPTEEAAHAAYCEAAKIYHGEFAKLG